MLNIPERTVHKQIIKYLRDGSYTFFHIQNERVNLTKMQMINRYQMGVVAGAPDICILLKNGKSLFVEVKSTIGRISPAQKIFHKRIIELGHEIIIARTIVDVVTQLYKNRTND